MFDHGVGMEFAGIRRWARGRSPIGNDAELRWHLVGLRWLRRELVEMDGSLFLTLAVVGFLAQLIDGALGMAFGVISATALLTLGYLPAHASAVVHTAFLVELGPVHMQAFLGLVIGGVIAAPLGAYVVKRLPARPLMAAVGMLVTGVCRSNQEIATGGRGLRCSFCAAATNTPHVSLGSEMPQTASDAGWQIPTSTWAGSGLGARGVRVPSGRPGLLAIAARECLVRCDSCDDLGAPTRYAALCDLLTRRNPPPDPAIVPIPGSVNFFASSQF